MPPRFLYPLLAYRSMVVPFLIVSSIVVPAWLVIRLYYFRRRKGPWSFYREFLYLIFAIYLSGLASATLTPNHGSIARAETAAAIDLRPKLASLVCSSASLPEDSTQHSFCVRNAGGNVLLFVPLGILIPLVWSRIRFWRGVAIALGVSVSIELIQYLSRAWGSYRLADVNDVILNVLGACVGLALLSLLRLRAGNYSILPRPA